MSAILKVVAVLGICLGVPLLLVAQSDEIPKEGATHKEENRWPARDSVPVKVVDEAGRPVQGARITPSALRIWETIMIWNEDTFGPPPTVQTNAEGIALVPYPVEVSEGNKTSSIVFEVDHPRFCRAYSGCSELTNKSGKRDDPPVILARGARLEVSGYIRGTGKPATGMLADRATLSWKESKPGLLTTSRFPTGRTWLRLMLLQLESSASFSDVVESDLKPRESKHLRVELKPGVRLEGKLDPDVPRPVHNGWASIAIVAKSAYDVSAKLDEKERLSELSKKTGNELVAEQLENLKLKGLQDPWTWNASIRIQEDGSFVFPSLPEGEAGVVAGCDGYASTDPRNAGGDALVAMGGFVIRDAHHITIHRLVASFIVPTEKTGTAEFKVIDPEGKPISDATVRFWPAWHWQNTQDRFGWSPYGSANVLRDASIFRKPRVPFPSYTATSDADGNARVSNLPSGEHLYSVTHPSFSPPAESDLPFSENPQCSLLIEPGKISKHTSQMRAKW